MTQAVAEVEVFLEVISASTPKHTSYKKSRVNTSDNPNYTQLYWVNIIEKMFDSWYSKIYF
jgi:hypothetical protein